MGFESIVNRVQTLPPLPESVQKIQALYAGGEPDVKSLIKIVESDPVMTADLLARMNAPLYSFSRRIVSVSQAVPLFGLNPLRGFVLSSAASESLPIDMNPYGISNEKFKQICELQSALMFQWYMGVDIERCKVLVPLSFLMEMGKVVIAIEVSGSDFAPHFKAEIENGASIRKTEKLFTDMTSAEVGAKLFEHWNFSDAFSDSIRFMDDPNIAPEETAPFAQALDVVQSAVGVGGIFTEASLAAARSKLVTYRLEVERFMRVVERLKRKLEEL